VEIINLLKMEVARLEGEAARQTNAIGLLVADRDRARRERDKARGDCDRARRERDAGERDALAVQHALEDRIDSLEAMAARDEMALDNAQDNIESAEQTIAALRAELDAHLPASGVFVAVKKPPRKPAKRRKPAKGGKGGA